MAALTEKQTKLLTEVLKDCESTIRLNEWEQNFIDDLRGRFVRFGTNTMISEKQWDAFRKIEEKIYE